MTLILFRRQTVLISLLAAWFLVNYFMHSALPGNNPAFPLGWWGWFDQGEYLKAAKAISNFDFSSGNYFYPPLYPLLGAAFVSVNPMHAFTLVNIVCFLLFAHYFVLMATRYINWWLAVLVLVLTFISPQNIVFDVWVEPWTSTLVSAIFAFLLCDVDKFINNVLKITNLRLMVWGALGGTVFLTRPVDAVVIAPLFVYVVWHIWRGATVPDEKISSAVLRIRNTSALVFSGMLGVVLFLVFNLLVHGSFGGRYFAMADKNGFHMADIFEKLVSLFLDAGPIYNVPDESIFAKLKWLALVVPAAIFGLVKGGATIRIIVVCIAVQLLIYAPYADLLPNGVWHFHNVHYFKWFFPYASLLIVLWLGGLFFKSSNLRTKYAWWLSLVLGVILLSFNFRLKEIDPNEFRVSVFSDGQKDNIRINSVSGAHLIDKVSFPNLTGGFHEVYFSGDAKVKADGVSLNYVRDFRFLPAPSGSDLVFIRPIKADTIEIDLGSMKLGGEQTQPRFFVYRYAIGKLKWVR